MKKKLLYLIQAELFGGYLLKIGYTTNLTKRLKTYRTHNPSVKLLKTREGTRALEAYSHDYFKEFAYPGFSEWFYYNDKIYNEFDIITIPEDKIIIKDSKRRILNSLMPKPPLEILAEFRHLYKSIAVDNDFLKNTVYSIYSCIKDYINSLDCPEISNEFVCNNYYTISFSLFNSDFTVSLSDIIYNSKLNKASINKIDYRFNTSLSNDPIENYLDQRDVHTKKLLALFDHSRELGPDSQEAITELIGIGLNTNFCELDYISIQKINGIDEVVFDSFKRDVCQKVLRLFRLDYENRF